MFWFHFKTFDEGYLSVTMTSYKNSNGINITNHLIISFFYSFEMSIILTETIKGHMHTLYRTGNALVSKRIRPFVKKTIDPSSPPHPLPFLTAASPSLPSFLAPFLPLSPSSPPPPLPSSPVVGKRQMQEFSSPSSPQPFNIHLSISLGWQSIHPQSNLSISVAGISIHLVSPRVFVSLHLGIRIPNFIRLAKILANINKQTPTHAYT